MNSLFLVKYVCSEGYTTSEFFKNCKEAEDFSKRMNGELVDCSNLITAC